MKRVDDYTPTGKFDRSGGTMRRLMGTDERSDLQRKHAREITRFNWSRFLAGVACGLGLALVAFQLFGCGAAPRSSADEYTGRDRYQPSPIRVIHDSPFGEGFDPRRDDG